MTSISANFFLIGFPILFLSILGLVFCLVIKTSCNFVRTCPAMVFVSLSDALCSFYISHSKAELFFLCE